MTESNGHAPADAPRADENTKEAEAATTTVQPEAAPDIEKLKQEATESRDRWLRALAEMENLRRRTEREIVDARSYGVTALARDIVAVADNLHRALAAVGPEAREGAEAGIQALIEGVELIDRELHKTLEKHGVRKLAPQGQKFDPNFHQAMLEIPDASVPAGTVVQVMQDGYTIADRVLRPALVGVAKGGPKAQQPAANDNPEGAAAEASADKSV
ncbi:MAG: molecular chaperone GrpE [Variibacter sp.]|jgi:molecular chaperone GrpE|nr:molecular chaperone GrpE [Variibacter sp.]